MLVLPLLILLQAMPPPLGSVVASAWFGLGRHTDHIIVLPGPSAVAPDDDCNCGVPASPRGPR